MAGRRFLESPNLEVLLKNEEVQRSLLKNEEVQRSFFLGSWPLVNFEYDNRNSQKSPLFKPIELDDMADGDFDDCIHHPEKKRKLTADQVQFLEQSFEFENKLEPERKLQIAKFLGLKPRQIAIWFQNRRARWKTKQLEKDYEALKSSFDTLKLDHDFLLKEKEQLQAEVLFLTKNLLVKEKIGNLEPSELNRLPNKLPNSNSTFGFEVKPCKQEGISSSESRKHIDQAGCSMLMELTSSSVPPLKSIIQIGRKSVQSMMPMHATEQDLWLWT